MKEGHYLVIFFVIIIVSMLALDHRANALSVTTMKDQDYDRDVEECIQTAYDNTLDYYEITTNNLLDKYQTGDNAFDFTLAGDEDFKAKFVDYYFKEMDAKSYAFRDEPKQMRIQTSFPVIAFVDTKGITVNYIVQNVKGEIYRTTSKQLPWDNSITPGLNQCKKDSKAYYAYWEKIEDTLNYFTNKFGNNGLPLKEGVSITLERVSGDSYNNVGKEFVGIYVVSMIQGVYDEYSTKYRLAGLNKLVLADFPYYVISRNKSTGVLEYHTPDCSQIGDKITYKTSKEECAKYGAYPCAECAP